MTVSIHLLPMSYRLESLMAAICDYYLTSERTMPIEIAQMLPCVQDAIEDGTPWYVELIYALFSIVVEEFVLWRKL
jgi:hypothetical protein